VVEHPEPAGSRPPVTPPPQPPRSFCRRTEWGRSAPGNLRRT
jgi:hypothetical protein